MISTIVTQHATRHSSLIDIGSGWGLGSGARCVLPRLLFSLSRSPDVDHSFFSLFFGSKEKNMIKEKPKPKTENPETNKHQEPLSHLHNQPTLPSSIFFPQESQPEKEEAAKGTGSAGLICRPFME